MKTPLEILEEHIDRINGIVNIEAAMEAYHFQFDGECEWEFECSFAYPSCDKPNYRFFDDRWTYCPFCGLKIKKVPQGGETI